MPYIAAKSRQYFDERPLEAKTDGEVTYVFYREFLKMWKAEPRWKTYATMRKTELGLQHLPDIHKLAVGLRKNGVDSYTILVGVRTAIDEIKRRYVDAYEDGKIQTEGDII